jgi:hypothetical protein
VGSGGAVRMNIDESKLWYCEKKGYPDEYLKWVKADKPVIVEKPDGTKEIMSVEEMNKRYGND